MTFEELIRKVAQANDLSLAKTQKIISDTLNYSADAAEKGAAPVFPRIGRLVSVPVRSTGRRPDGSVWTKPGRTKLALRPSKHRGGRDHRGGRATRIANSIEAPTGT